MFKFVLVCALFAVAISSPVPNDVRKSGSVQKTSEYFPTAQTKPSDLKSSGLTRPSPINPNVQSDPKPQDSTKIIPASLTDENAKSVVQPAAATVNTPKLQSSPARTVNTDSHVGQATHVENTKVPAPVLSVENSNKPTVSRTVNDNNYRPTVVSVNPAAHLESNPSIASPGTSIKSTQPSVVGVEKKVVKRESTSDAADSTSSDSDSANRKSDKRPSKLSSNDDSNYDRDNQPPKYVHPVPVTQIIKNGPPAEIHQENHPSEE